MPRRPSSHPTEAQLEVLNILWLGLAAAVVVVGVLAALVAVAVPLGCGYTAPPPSGPAVRSEAGKGQAAEKAAGELVWADEKSGKVLFRGRDIVRFDPRRQVFLLRRDSAIDVEAWLCNRPSRGFVVRDRAGVIYTGRFIVDKRGIAYDGPTVLIGGDGPESPLFAVTGGYPRATAQGGEVLRHPRLLAGLKAAGVFGTIDEDYKAMPFKRRTAGWAGQVPGLRIAANVYAGTFRIGRTGRVLLIFRKDGPFDLPGDTVEIRTTVRGLHAAKFASVRTETVSRERFGEMIDAGAYVHEVRNWWGPADGAEDRRAKPGPAEVSVELVLREKVKDKPETTRPVKTISLFSVKLGILPDATLARARNVSPADDLAAVGSFLDHIVPRLPQKWKLSHVGYGQFVYSRPDRGFDVTFYNENVPAVNGRRTTVDTHMRIASAGAEQPHRDATELPRWRGKRVFVWGGRKHWADNDKDIAAALAATAGGSVGEPMPAGTTLRAAAAFVANLHPRIPEGWQWTSIGYDALGATHPRGWSETPGHQGVQLRLDRPNRTWPTDTSAGSVSMSLTIMDPFYAGEPAKASPDSPTGSVAEIARLADRRVFADLRNVGYFWDGFVKEDLRAAVKATVDQRGPTGRGVAYLFKVAPPVRGPNDRAWGYDSESSAPLRKAMLPLLAAVAKGDMAAVRKIVEARPELAKAACPPSYSSYGTLGLWAAQGLWAHYDSVGGITSLHVAASMGRLEIAAYLLTGGAAVNAKDGLGQTPLHFAALLGQAPRKGVHWPYKTLEEAVRQRQALIVRREALARFLLAKGADINATDRKGHTPLVAAAKGDNPIIAKLLLARGAKLDIFSAIRLGLLEHVEAMLKIAPACLHLGGGRDTSPLHVAAELVDPAAAGLLLRRGAKLGIGEHGDTPLARAVRAGRTETTRALLAAGALPDWAKCSGKPALNYAAREGHLEIVKLLFARGAKLETVDNDNHTALFNAAYAGRMAVAKFLLDNGADVNGGAQYDNPPLRGVTYLVKVDHEVDPSGARHERMKAMAALLIARGAKVDVLSAAGLGMLDRLRAIGKADPASVHFTGAGRSWNQPLIWAAERKQLAAAKLLLDAGAMVNAPGPWHNSTALHHAAGAGDLEMCTLLLDRGANVRATTKQKDTPLHWAMSRDKNAPVVKLLLDHGADPNAKGAAPRHETPLDTARIHGHDDLVQLVRSHVKASAKPAKCTLAFRIVPNAIGSSRQPVLPLFVGQTQEKFAARATADLAALGPGAVADGDGGLKLRWFELACDAPAGGFVGRHKGKRYILLCDDPRYIIVRGTGKDAWELTSVSRAPGSGRGGPSILVKFDQRGALRTKQITEANKGNVMAVVIDGKVVAAPVIRSTMSTHAIITGKFTDAEVARLIRALRRGMPASRGKDQ